MLNIYLVNLDKKMLRVLRKRGQLCPLETDINDLEGPDILKIQREGDGGLKIQIFASALIKATVC
jgi:hypothetical protein